MANQGSTKMDRVYSLDALRGFDMFWISGGDILMISLAAFTGWPIFNWAAEQMEHVAWNGFHFYDMIFPLFLFIAGVSMPYSIAKRKDRGESMSKIYTHLLIRLFLLLLLGIIHNRFLQFDFENQRYASVLGRIGLGWFFAAVIMLNTNIRGQLLWFWGILLAYWAAMALIPVPGYGAGNFTQEGSLAGYVDRLLLPGRLYLGNHDPEGIFSTIPAISTALLGVLTGQLLAGNIKKYSPFQKVMFLFAAGIICLILGKVWGIVFPINKNLWTSSFVLFAGGWSLLLLTVFYLIIDVWGFRKWSFFFVVIGLNSILIYMLNGGIMNFEQMGGYFFGGLAKLFSDPAGNVILISGSILCMWTFLYILYRNRIFLKI
jgi:predicted acyltransferase